MDMINANLKIWKVKLKLEFPFTFHAGGYQTQDSWVTHVRSRHVYSVCVIKFMDTVCLRNDWVGECWFCMFVLCLEWPPLAPSHFISIGHSGRVKRVYIYILRCSWRRYRSLESHDACFFSHQTWRKQLAIKNWIDSTFGQVIVRGVPDSVTRDNQNKDSTTWETFWKLVTMWTAKWKKKTWLLKSCDILSGPDLVKCKLSKLTLVLMFVWMGAGSFKSTTICHLSMHCASQKCRYWYFHAFTVVWFEKSKCKKTP